jgi:tRNA dimethylallyltransferase
MRAAGGEPAVTRHAGSAASPPPNTVLILAGPTASGKTPVSLLVAEEIDAEILSADSRQMYRFMDIGTAKIPAEARRKIRHHLIDALKPDEHFDAAEFGRRGRAIIRDILARRKIPLVVGGSGLYLRALIDGFFDGPPADDEIREELERRKEREGGEALLEELRGVDPAAAARMLPSHTRRIIRALEVHRLTGIPISTLQEKNEPASFRSVHIGLQWPRELLYDRINERVDQMMKAGFLDEVKRLKALGYAPPMNALNTVGYKELFQVLEERITCERAVEQIKRETRRYAKRQLTWFRRDARIRWFPLRDERDFPAVAHEICRHFLAAAT